MSIRSGDATDELIRFLAAKCPPVATSTEALHGGSAPLRWQHMTIGDVPGLSELLGIVEPPVKIVSVFLDVIAAILDVIKTFLVAFPDPIRAIVMAAYQMLKTIVDDFLATGAYVYVDVPGLLSNRKTLNDMGARIEEPPTWLAGDEQIRTARPAAGFEAWAATFKQSFDDPGDENRPVFSDGAPVEALFLVSTMPNMVDFGKFAELWGKLLDIDGFKKLFEDFKFPVPDPDRHNLQGRSTAPDWRTWNISNIAPPDYPMRKLRDVPEFLKSILLNVENILGMLANLVDLVKAKVLILKEFIKLIESVIAILKALSDTGFHALAVSTDEGVEGLVKAFLEAEDRPNPPTETGEKGPASAIMGACFMAGSSGAVPFNPHMLWAMLGQGQSFEQAYAGTIEDWEELRDVSVEKAKDIKAMASKAWEGVEGQNGVDGKGITGLWGDFEDEATAAGEEWIANLNNLPEDLARDVTRTLNHIGLTLEEAEAFFRNDRNGFIAMLENAYATGLGAPASPVVLAHIEATRRARQRGARGMAAAAAAGVWPAATGDS